MGEGWKRAFCPAFCRLLTGCRRRHASSIFSGFPWKDRYAALRFILLNTATCRRRRPPLSFPLLTDDDAETMDIRLFSPVGFQHARHHIAALAFRRRRDVHMNRIIIFNISCQPRLDWLRRRCPPRPTIAAARALSHFLSRRFLLAYQAACRLSLSELPAHHAMLLFALLLFTFFHPPSHRLLVLLG